MSRLSFCLSGFACVWRRAGGEADRQPARRAGRGMADNDGRDGRELQASKQARKQPHPPSLPSPPVPWPLSCSPVLNIEQSEQGIHPHPPAFLPRIPRKPLMMSNPDPAAASAAASRADMYKIRGPGCLDPSVFATSPKNAWNLPSSVDSPPPHWTQAKDRGGGPDQTPRERRGGNHNHRHQTPPTTPQKPASSGTRLVGSRLCSAPPPSSALPNGTNPTKPKRPKSPHPRSGTWAVDAPPHPPRRARVWVWPRLLLLLLLRTP